MQKVLGQKGKMQLNRSASHKKFMSQSQSKLMQNNSLSKISSKKEIMAKSFSSSKPVKQPDSKPQSRTFTLKK